MSSSDDLAFMYYLQTGSFPLGYEVKRALNPQFNEGGVPEVYIWRTRGDGKVSAEHAANDGKIFLRDNPPSTGHPGQAFGCRCVAEAVELPEVKLPEDIEELPEEIAGDIELFPIPDSGVAERVYPELYLIPGVSGVFKIGKYALHALREWQRGRGRVSDKAHRQEAARHAKPGKFKGATRWKNQFQKRGWTMDKVREFILKGKRTEAPNRPNEGNGASKYSIGKDYVVMDDTTHEIIQISDTTDPLWK